MNTYFRYTLSFTLACISLISYGSSILTYHEKDNCRSNTSLENTSIGDCSLYLANNFKYKEDGFMGFHRLCTTYNKRVLIYALDRIGRKENINNITLPIDIDYSLYIENVDTALINQPHLLDILLDNVYLDSRRDLIIKYMSNWCYIYSIISMPYNLESPIYLEEILYKNVYSKDIVESFLNYPEQDWGSLSSSQLAELPFRLCDSFYRKNEKDLLLFYESFFKTITKLIDNL